jgi:phosphoserine phosphatase
MLRIGVRLRAELDDVFSQINRQLCQDLGAERFVTAFLGLLDPAAHRINYHSAGQAPLLHFHAQTHKFEWLDSSMLPLGIDDQAESEGGVRRMQIEPGDLIILLTDGFYEYQNPAGELLGQERIAEVILQHHPLPARELLDEILKATRAFGGAAPQLDDMTGVIIRRLPPN